MTTEEAVIYLASCAINGEVPNQELVNAMELDKVLDFAKKHKISCCVAMAIESAGIKKNETVKAISNAMRRNALFETSLKEVTGKLEEAGIWYIPLKGILLKKYYPKPFMREMADHDILIDASRAEDVKKIMEGLGFSTETFGKRNHDNYHKKPVLNYEMHTSLFPPKDFPVLYEYYRNKKELPVPDDFYLFLVAHEYKHFARNGTGLRSLMDIYLYLKKETPDWDYVEKEAEKLGIREFERKNRHLAVDLFGRGEVTDEEMLSNILASGMYGSFAHRIEIGINKNDGNRILYILRRFSVPVRMSDPDYKNFMIEYPMFYKCKILLPLLPFYRIFRAVKLGRFAKEWRIIRKYRKGSKQKKT